MKVPHVPNYFSSVRGPPPRQSDQDLRIRWGDIEKWACEQARVHAISPGLRSFQGKRASPCRGPKTKLSGGSCTRVVRR